jgi:hypothetical protein
MWHGFDMYGLIYSIISLRSNHRKIDSQYAYTSVSTVCSSALLGRLVDLDVLDDQVAGIKTLGIGVCLCVLEETEQELGGLDWPSSSGDAKRFACVILSIYVSATNLNFLRSRDIVPCAARPVPPAYLLIGTASLCSWTFSKNLIARCSFQPLIA